MIADAGIQPSTGRRQTISPIAGTNRTVTGASGCAPGSGKIASLQCCGAEDLEIMPPNSGARRAVDPWPAASLLPCW